MSTKNTKDQDGNFLTATEESSQEVRVNSAGFVEVTVFIAPSASASMSDPATVAAQLFALFTKGMEEGVQDEGTFFSFIKKNVHSAMQELGLALFADIRLDNAGEVRINLYNDIAMDSAIVAAADEQENTLQYLQ